MYDITQMKKKIQVFFRVSWVSTRRTSNILVILGKHFVIIENVRKTDSNITQRFNQPNLS